MIKLLMIIIFEIIIVAHLISLKFIENTNKSEIIQPISVAHGTANCFVSVKY